MIIRMKSEKLSCSNSPNIFFLNSLLLWIIRW